MTCVLIAEELATQARSHMYTDGNGHSTFPQEYHHVDCNNLPEYQVHIGTYTKQKIPEPLTRFSECFYDYYNSPAAV